MKATNKAKIEGVAEKAKEAGRKLADQVTTVAESGKEEAAQMIQERKEQAVSTVRDLDDVLRRTAEEVENPGLGRQIERLADEVDRLAGTLENTGLDDMLQSAERLSRQNPGLFLTAGFAIGLAASRFLKASSRRSFEPPLALPASRAALGTPGHQTGEFI